MSKKTILMLPSWYPTEQNPYSGSFFREQALALSNNFNFIVVRYFRKKEVAIIYALKKLFGKSHPAVAFEKDDNGMQQYVVQDFCPQFIFWDLLTDRFNYVVKHKLPRTGSGITEPKSQVKARKRSVRYLKKKNLIPSFDCVYSLTAQDMAAIGDEFASAYGVPHVTAEHAPFPWPGHLLYDSNVTAIEKADAFLAISNDKIRQVAIQNVHVNPIWVGNMCDETKFRYVSNNNEVPVFLIVAANNFYKNYPLFIKSMEELKRIAEKDFKVLIVGYNATKGYSDSADALETTVKNSIIAENTTMIPAATRDEITGIYNSSDVFVMTSVQEGLPVSALEASMSGLPVFSTRCGGVEDYVDDTMGRIFAISDYKGIAEACNDYLNKKITFDNNHIREKAVSLFGKEAFVKRMTDVFVSVLNRK